MIPQSRQCRLQVKQQKTLKLSLTLTTQKWKAEKNKELLTNSGGKSQLLLILEINFQMSICCDEHVVLEIECDSILFGYWICNWIRYKCPVLYFLCLVYICNVTTYMRDFTTYNTNLTTNIFNYIVNVFAYIFNVHLIIWWTDITEYWRCHNVIKYLCDDHWKRSYL